MDLSFHDSTPLPGLAEASSFRWLQPGELLAIPVPTAALQLDALLRHLEIDGEFGDWPAASAHLAQARTSWERLEPALGVRVAGHAYLRGARKAARELGRCLEKAEDAIRRGRRPQLVEQARAAIARVETIERAFE